MGTRKSLKLILAPFQPVTPAAGGLDFQAQPAGGPARGHLYSVQYFCFDFFIPVFCLGLLFIEIDDYTKFKDSNFQRIYSFRNANGYQLTSTDQYNNLYAH